MTKEIKAIEPVIQSSTSFDGKHSLVFNEKSHRYKLDGEACPGVTTILKSSYPTSLGLISWMQGQAAEYVWNKLIAYEVDEKEKEQTIKESKLAWKEKAQEAADVGTITHSYAELWSKGEQIKAEELLVKIKDSIHWPKIKTCVDKYLDWYTQNKRLFHSAEGLIAAPTLKFCGKYDLLSTKNGCLILSDYKTSKGIYTEQLVQLAAYRRALRDWCHLNIEAIEILRFGKEDGEFETRFIDDSKILDSLEEQAVRCVQTYYFIKEFDKE